MRQTNPFAAVTGDNTVMTMQPHATLLCTQRFCPITWSKYIVNRIPGKLYCSTGVLYASTHSAMAIG